MTSALVMQILTYAVPLVAGYLLRHYGVSIPLLPSPTAPGSAPVFPPVPATPSTAPHVSLLQQVLGVAKTDAEALLQQAVQLILQKGLTDQVNAAKAVSAPVPAPKS